MTDDGSRLHPRLGESEDEDRVAQRVADLEVAARGHRDELFAVHLEDRGGRIDAGAAIELPQDRAGLGVVGFEPAVALAREYQAAGRGGRAAHHRQVGLHGPRDLAGVQVDRVDVAPLTRVTTLVVRDTDEGAAEPEAPVLPRGIVGLVVHRLVQAHRVRVREIRVHGDRGPFLAAVRAREHEHALGGRLRVHALLRHERRRLADQLAGRRVEHIHESGLARFDHGLLAADHGDDGRTHGVKVPHVVRYFLVAPLELAVGRADRHDALGPEIVAGADAAIQVGRRVADRDVQRLGRVVVGRGHPHRPAAVLPGVGVLGRVGLLLGDIAVQVLTLPGRLGPLAPPAAVQRIGQRVPGPGRRAARRAVRLHEAADAVLGFVKAYSTASGTPAWTWYT